MIFCSSCGNQLSEDAKFCGKCGTSTAGDQAQPAFQQQDTNQQPAFQTANTGYPSGYQPKDFDIAVKKSEGLSGWIGNHLTYLGYSSGKPRLILYIVSWVLFGISFIPMGALSWLLIVAFISIDIILIVLAYQEKNKILNGTLKDANGYPLIKSQQS